MNTVLYRMTVKEIEQDIRCRVYQAIIEFSMTHDLFPDPAIDNCTVYLNEKTGKTVDFLDTVLYENDLSSGWLMGFPWEIDPEQEKDIEIVKVN